MDTLNTLLGVFMVGEFMERKYGGFALADSSALHCVLALRVKKGERSRTRGKAYASASAKWRMNQEYPQ